MDQPEELADRHFKFLNSFADILGRNITYREEFLFKNGFIHGHKHGREDIKE